MLSALLPPTKLKAQIAVKPGDEQLFAAQPKQYPFTLVAYGDLRTTHPSNHFVTDPNRRRVLIARIAAEKPDLLVVNGDLVYKGGSRGDWPKRRRLGATFKSRYCLP
ncbi:MAG TPA: metallophosphoesterase family protein [Terriglobales bacterium]|nr:metallophosphoesterase family protein [Terriglobales bacterium]